MKPRILGTITVLSLVILWQILAMIIGNVYVLPNPVSALQTLFILLMKYETYVILSMSIFRLLIVIALASIIGVISGVLSGESEIISALLQPIVIGLRTIPVASVIIIILILIGRNIAIYPITFLMLYPIFHEGAKQGIRHISPSLVNALKLESVPYLAKIIKVKLPLAMPYIKTALLQSMGLGFKVLIMAEFIAQVDTSIGRALYLASLRIEYAEVFAWTIIIIVIVFVIDVFVNRLSNTEKI